MFPSALMVADMDAVTDWIVIIWHVLLYFVWWINRSIQYSSKSNMKGQET